MLGNRESMEPAVVVQTRLRQTRRGRSLEEPRHPHPCLTAAAQTCRRRRARGDARSGPEGDI